jgi:tRNA/rRNA methyltransferase
VHDTLADAVADCAHVFATTVRKRGVTKPVMTPQEAALNIHQAQGRSAIVFGPERSGLEKDEVALARAIVTVPVNPDFASLNLAQAVILCTYEWSKLTSMEMPTAEEALPPALQDELEGLIAHFEALLEPRSYFWPKARAAASRRTLRNMLTKPAWNSFEVRTLRGILSTLEKTPRKRD